MTNYDIEEREEDLQYAIDTGIIPKEYRGDKEFVLEVLKNNTMISSELDENLRNDKEVIFEELKRSAGLSMDVFEHLIGEELKSDINFMNIISEFLSESNRLFHISVSESETIIQHEYKNLINKRINLLLNNSKGNEIDEYLLKSSSELINFYEGCFVPSKTLVDFHKTKSELSKDAGLMIDKSGEIVGVNEEHKEKAKKLVESVEENKKLNEELQELQKQNEKNNGEK